MDTNEGPTTASVTTENGAPPGGRAAAALLELAARDAEAWRTEAKAEADELVAKARAEAEQLVSTARAEAARIRAEQDAAKTAHEGDVARLQQFHSDTRDQLRGHLTSLLSQLDQQQPTAGQQ